MERYFPKVPKTSQSDSKKSRYHPYKSQHLPLGVDSCSNRSVPKLTVNELNRSLLNSLSDIHNPITHSDAKDRADRVVSISTGHQVSEERPNRALYLQHREKKLSMQQGSNCNSSGVLRSVRAYISGYLNGTTDIEMKRIITEAGGQTVYVIPCGPDPNDEHFHPSHCQYGANPVHPHCHLSMVERFENTPYLDHQDEKFAIRGPARVDFRLYRQGKAAARKKIQHIYRPHQQV